MSNPALRSTFARAMPLHARNRLSAARTYSYQIVVAVGRISVSAAMQMQGLRPQGGCAGRPDRPASAIDIIAQEHKQPGGQALLGAPAVPPVFQALSQAAAAFVDEIDSRHGEQRGFGESFGADLAPVQEVVDDLALASPVEFRMGPADVLEPLGQVKVAGVGEVGRGEGQLPGAA